MAEKWAFPNPIRDVIERHHHASPLESGPMLEAVMIANEVAKTVRNGFEDEEDIELPESVAAAAKRIKLKQGGYERICTHTLMDLDSLKQSFGIAA